MTPFLELKSVSKIYSSGIIHKKHTVALENFSMSINTDKPAVRAIAGESGSGKTTLGMILMGFLQPTSGNVLYNGKDMRSLNRSEQNSFRRDVQAIFQDPFSVYNPFYPVEHVLEMPIEKFKMAKSKAAAKRLMEDALSEVGLQPAETLGRFPHQLSGGQRQRIMVARALLLKPKLIIADEPVSMVDASLRATILESLRKLNREFGITILYITHDLTTAYHVSNDIMVLYRGELAEVGDVENVIKNPQHPYTQLLVDSIPWPDLDQTWGSKEISVSKNAIKVGMEGFEGCRFADRCPHMMSVCTQKDPPLYRVDPTRASACFLHQDTPELAREEVDQLLA